MDRVPNEATGGFEMASRKISLKDLKTPKRLYPDTLLVENGKSRAVIVRPKDDAYASLAEQVRAEIRTRSGVDLPIILDDAVDGPPRENLIVLGNVNTNRLVFQLYGYNYTPADDLYPGLGGHVVQTIHDPWGTGRNAVGLLGSDAAGVRAAVNRFAGLLKEGQTLSVGRTFDVKFGRGALKIPKLLDEPDLEAEMAGAEEALKRGEHTGLWGRIGDRGLLYGLTGNEVYAELFKRLVYRMYAHAMSGPDNYGGIWGFDADFALNRVIPGWDLVEESPVVTDEDRLKITRILFEFVSDCVSHVGNVDVAHVRHNHSTFAALGLHYAGTYFKKYYGAREADEWLRLSDRCFQVQARASKPHEDCSGYQWLTHYHLTRWSLSSGDMTFFENGNARKAADYAMLTTDNLGYALPYGDNAAPFGWWSELPFLRAAVCVMGDGRYQWMLDKKTAVEPRYAAYEYHRQVLSRRADDLDGVQTFPVDALYYASNNGKAHLPLKKTFDKVVFRDGFDPESQYLFLDGLSNGGHKHYDGNSICRLTENHRIWLADCDYIKSLPKFHNGVLIFKDGQSAPIPPFAELERSADFAHSGFSETTLRSYSGVDWHRNILWNRGRYFLVVDEMTALEANDYTFRAIWQTLGEVGVAEGGLAVTQNGEQFFIKGLPGPRLKLTNDAETGKNWAVYTHAEPVVRILQQIADVHLKADETYRYFNLLYCSDEAQQQRLKMTQMTDGAVRIEGGDETTFAGVGSSDTLQQIPSGPAVAAAEFLISPSRFALVDGTLLTWGSASFKSDKPVSVEYDLPSGTGIVVASTGTRIGLPADGRKAVMVDGKRVDGRKSGAMVTFAIPKGRHRVALVSELVSTIRRLADKQVKPKVTSATSTQARKARVRTLKTVWTFGDTGAFLSMRSADLDGDGKAEVVAGGRGGAVCAVKEGQAIWRFVTEDEVRSVWTADLEGDGKIEVIVGSADTRVYTLDSEGKERWRFEVPLYYRKPMLKTVFAADINGDGLLEVIAGAESWRYYAFTHDGKELWHHMTVHSSTHGCAADLDGDGKAEVIAGTEYYHWHCIDGNGESRWSYRTQTGPRTNAVAAGDVDGDGLKEVAFAGADTHIHMLNSEGKLLWLYNTGDEVTQVVMADVDGDGLDEVVASSMSFSVYVLKGDGKRRLWRTDLREVVRCISVADFDGDGKLEVAAGTEDGAVYVLANDDGRVISRFQTGGSILSLAAADVDGDGIAEVIAASEDETLYALKV
jgi:hypothetical protein